MRQTRSGYTLTVRVLELGMTYVQQVDMWDVARPRLQELVAKTGESSSIAELDGSDIVYVARVAVPKLIALVVRIGTKFPAAPTSLGKVLLAGLTDDQVAQVIAEPSRSGVEPRWRPDLPELLDALAEVRAQGWSLTDEQLASGIRSVAAPLRDGSGAVRAAMNVTVHAAETSTEVLLETAPAPAPGHRLSHQRRLGPPRRAPTRTGGLTLLRCTRNGARATWPAGRGAKAQRCMMSARRSAP